jgi:hypothetical protein
MCSVPQGLAAANAIVGMVNSASGDKTQLMATIVDTFSQLASSAAATQPNDLLRGLRDATASNVSTATVASSINILSTVLLRRQTDMPRDQVFQLSDNVMKNLVNALSSLKNNARVQSGPLRLMAADPTINATDQLYVVVRNAVGVVTTSLLTVPGDTYSFTQSGLATKVVRLDKTAAGSASVTDSATTVTVTVAPAALASLTSSADVSVVLATTNSYGSVQPTGATARVASPSVTVFLDDSSVPASPTPVTIATGQVSVDIPATCTVSTGQTCTFRCYSWDAATSAWLNTTVATQTIAVQQTSGTVTVTCKPTAAGTLAVFDASTTAPDAPPTDTPSSSSPPVAAIAGGIAGAVAFIALVVVCRRRRSASSARVTDYGNPDAARSTANRVPGIDPAAHGTMAPLEIEGNTAQPVYGSGTEHTGTPAWSN